MEITKDTILELNDELEMQFIPKGRVALRVNDVFKMISCSQKALQYVLDKMTEPKTVERLLGDISDKYSEELALPFIEGLVKSEVLIQLGNNTPASSELYKIGYFGPVELYDQVQALSNIVSSLKNYTLLFCHPKSFKDDLDAYLVVTDEMTVSEVIKLTGELYHSNKTHTILRFHREFYELGPTVIPGKSACFSCECTYKLQELNKGIPKGKKLTLEEIGRLSPSTLLAAYLEEHVRAVKESVGDLIQSVSGGYFPGTVGSKIHKGYGTTQELARFSYAPTTSCPCCHGLFQNYQAYTASIQEPVAIELGKQNACYCLGGLRSFTEDDAKSLVDSAIWAVGLQPKIKKLNSSPLHKIFDCYQAELKLEAQNEIMCCAHKLKTRGKGLTETQSYLSAAFELVERTSVQCARGDLLGVHGSYREVAEHAINLEPYVRQIRNSETPYKQFDSCAEMDWVWAHSLIDGKARLVPAWMAYLSETQFKGQFFGVASTGLSSGACIEDAMLQGLLEAVEHDAWFINQANPIELPLIDYRESTNSKLKEKISLLLGIGRKLVVRDYTCDTNIPVFRAWIVDEQSHTHYAFDGFGASLDPEIALERAITEAALSDSPDFSRRLRYGADSAVSLASARESLYSLYYFVHKDIKPQTSLRKLSSFAYDPKFHESVAHALEEVCRRIRQAVPSADILCVNLTQKKLGIPVVRMIVTGDFQRACHPLLLVSERCLGYQKYKKLTDRVTNVDELYMGPYPH